MLMLALNRAKESNLLFIRVSGKLTKEDYEAFGSRVEGLIREHGKIRVLMRLEDFRGWSPAALWEDIKFDIKHFRDIERVAVVGERRWEKGMTTFYKPFTAAEVRYFDKERSAEAKQWIDA